MKIVISGASGFIGSSLVKFFESSPEYEVFKLVRHKTNRPDEIFWNPTEGTILQGSINSNS
jgi:nucleoside-diphosphate-sugar epimerase